MFSSINTPLRVICLMMLSVTFCVDAAQWSIESSVDSNIEYNDNIFLTNQDHDSVTSLIVKPALQMLVQEKNWLTAVDARLRSNNYSDSNLDSNDIFFDLSGTYITERNSYTLQGTLDFDSNLNSESTDFGITGRRVDRELLSITPQFSRNITERLLFTANYTHTDVDYVDADDTGFVPYRTDDVSGSLVYNLTETDQVNMVLQGTAYESKDGSFEYDLFSFNLGMNQILSETFSVKYLLGGSQRDSTSLSTEVFNFFGQPALRREVADFSNSGFVYDASFKKEWLSSSLKGHLSRNETTDSVGGLNLVETSSLNFDQKITSVWGYSIHAKYEDIKTLDANNQITDRDIVFLDSIVRYKLSKNLVMLASYQYVKRKFDSQEKSEAPYSNRIFVGISYDFPSISTN